MFEYTTITVKILGARSGMFSVFQNKGLSPESDRALVEMGRMGWELTGVIPLAVGAVGGQWVDSAICFFKRPVVQRKIASASSSQGEAEKRIEADEFDWLLNRQIMAERFASETGRHAGLSETDWKLITSAAYPEALPAVEAFIANAWRMKIELTSADHERIKMFYSHLDRSDLLQAAYRLIETSLWPERGLELIKEHQLFDVPSILGLLGNEDRRVRMNALKAMSALKEEYTVQDVRGLEEVRNWISGAFYESELVEKKGMLGGIKKYWKCSNCGREDCAEKETECPCCRADRFGVPPELGRLHGLLERIDRRLLVLRRRFGTEQPADVTELAQA